MSSSYQHHYSIQTEKSVRKKPHLNRSSSALFLRPKSSMKPRLKCPISNHTQIINSTICANNNNNNDVSFSFTAKLSSSLMNKDKLYAENLQLKTQVNQLKGEIALMKSEIRKKDSEILKKGKFIESVSNETKESDVNISKLKNQNEISKMKNSFKLLKKNLVLQKEENSKLSNEIKKQVISKLKQENENKYKELQLCINQYIHSILVNQQTEMKVQTMRSNLFTFHDKHIVIKNLQNAIEVAKKKTQKINNDIDKVKEEISIKENFVKKKNIENNNLIKQNEKLLAEKKERENYIFKKPVYEKKIKELQEKVDMYKKQETQNNALIKDLQKQNEDLEKKNKELKSHIAKPMNYNAVKVIEENPNNKISSKVMLLKSLINESKKRQEELKEILQQYSNA